MFTRRSCHNLFVIAPWVVCTAMERVSPALLSRTLDPSLLGSRKMLRLWRLRLLNWRRKARLPLRLVSSFETPRDTLKSRPLRDRRSWESSRSLDWLLRSLKISITWSSVLLMSEDIWTAIERTRTPSSDSFLSSPESTDLLDTTRPRSNFPPLGNSKLVLLYLSLMDSLVTQLLPMPW